MSSPFSTLITRASRFVLNMAAQAVPAAGVFRLSWPPAGAMVLYWIESVLALGGLVLLLWMFARRARLQNRADDLAEIKSRQIVTRDVLLLQGGAFAFWAVFYGAFLFILIANGFIDRSAFEPALRGAPVLGVLAVLMLLIDLVRFRGMTAADLELRVSAGNRRFAVFFFVGFIGFFAAVMLNRPLLLFAVFAVIKTLFEIGSFFDRRPVKI